MTSSTPPTISHEHAADVATAAYARLFELLDSLDEQAWRAPTDCDRWDVAAMVGHMIGAAKGNASMLESVRQQFWGLRHAKEFDGSMLDAFNELQVMDHAELTIAERLRELKAIAPDAVAGRMRTPRLLRRVNIPLAPGQGSEHSGLPARYNLGRLMDVIYTRDVWLHTVDIERATGVTVSRTADVDGVILADAVAEWFASHGQPVQLALTGPAGGSWSQGDGGPVIEMDAVEWARTVSGRASGAGLLASTAVLF